MSRIFLFFISICLLQMGCESNTTRPIDGSVIKSNPSDTTLTIGGNAASDTASMPMASTKDPIPLKVYQVLQYIRVHHAPMPGFEGGRVFGNFQGVLPKTDATGKTIAYQEWDVNKHIQGVNRGVERLCTGSDGRAWYTHDHYVTFTQVFDKKVPATDVSTTDAAASNIGTASATNNNGGDKIASVVAFVKANNAPMEGYQGGGDFGNRENLLPATDANGNDITYKMWDVNPSTNRGAERIVTGSDGRVWYSKDKFKSFSEYTGGNLISTPSTNNSPEIASPEKTVKPAIPAKVYTVLKYVLKNHAPMPNYVGGREFTNFEKVLPYADASGKKIFYQEWDVNPHVQGVNRGAERLCTGADGRNWYTSDHYITFVQVK